jgi:hypothetical protein
VILLTKESVEMIKKIRKLKVETCLEFSIEHPLTQQGEISMFVMKFPQINIYLFSIPAHKWSYVKYENEEINFMYGPSSFRYEKYKGQLINAMYRAVSIIENESIEKPLI